jgi:uncharacterized protein YbaA (DUF1428 family)
MTYIQGFVIPVPADRKQDFIAHAEQADAVFLEHGALRVWECWQDDVPPGEQTDFFRAVDAQEGECVVFSWIEWPDKLTCDAMHAQMEEIMANDSRFSMEHNPPPFEGKRMIYGGFVPVVRMGEA